MLINPGTGPIPDGTMAHAVNNLASFVYEVCDGHPVRGVRATPRVDPADDQDGRFSFSVELDLSAEGQPTVALDVLMPGLPLEHVNFGTRPDDSVFDFPRLYLNGSSWLWKFAVELASEEVARAVPAGQPPPRLLTCGYKVGLPGYVFGQPAEETVLAAWGARARVTQNGQVELGSDRQGSIGEPAAARELLAKLDSGLNQRWITQASGLLARHEMRTNAGREFVLAQEGGVTVKGNTLDSCGYLYVCAYVLT
jgi:hypothetical protein